MFAANAVGVELDQPLSRRAVKPAFSPVVTALRLMSALTECVQVHVVSAGPDSTWNVRRERASEKPRRRVGCVRTVFRGACVKCADTGLVISGCCHFVCHGATLYTPSSSALNSLIGVRSRT